jgi:hypothetical protein
VSAHQATLTGGRRLSRDAVVLLAGFALGLAIRLVLLPYKGTADMDTYLAWGQQTLDLGLPNAYTGIYFPFAFQVFGATIRLADVTGLSQFAAVKLVNLCADAATFGLLVLLLRRWGARPAYALLYWLSPFFLVIFWLGYVDAQLAVLLMAFVAILAFGRGPVVELAAGVPLALLALLKPQGALVVAALVALALIAFVRRHREILPVAALARMLVAPVLLFGFYSWWIGTSVLHGPGFLLETVRKTDSVMPSLSANMPNLWYVVAEAYRDPGEPIYAVMEPKAFRTIGTLLTLALVVGALWWLVPRRASRPLAQRVLIGIGAVMLIYPMTITAAHENHLFVGLLAMVPVAALLHDRRVTVWLCVLSTLQFANLFCLYGFGSNHLSGDLVPGIADTYGSGLRVAVAAASVLAWVALLLTSARAIDRR